MVKQFRIYNADSEKVNFLCECGEGVYMHVEKVNDKLWGLEVIQKIVRDKWQATKRDVSPLIMFACCLEVDTSI
jgi:hypothetical protein